MCASFLKRIQGILDNECIPYDDRVLAKLILRHTPDFRRVINELQRYSVSGSIDVGILAEVDNIKVKDLMEAMKAKNFGDVRQWVVENLDNDPDQLYRKIYDSLYGFLDPQSIPTCILILAEYQYKSAFVNDQEINTTACLVQIMMECIFK